MLKMSLFNLANSMNNTVYSKYNTSTEIKLNFKYVWSIHESEKILPVVKHLLFRIGIFLFYQILSTMLWFGPEPVACCLTSHVGILTLKYFCGLTRLLTIRLSIVILLLRES